MEILLHTADISNPVKQWNIYFQWAERVITEFWAQGDEERRLGLPINQLGDRYTPNTAKSQIGFIKFIVENTFEAVQRFLPHIKELLQNLQTNKAKWIEKIEEYDLKLKHLNEQNKIENDNI